MISLYIYDQIHYETRKQSLLFCLKQQHQIIWMQKQRTEYSHVKKSFLFLECISECNNNWKLK